jgi:hypothetical protein
MRSDPPLATHGPPDPEVAERSKRWQITACDTVSSFALVHIFLGDPCSAEIAARFLTRRVVPRLPKAGRPRELDSLRGAGATCHHGRTRARWTKLSWRILARERFESG